MILMITHNTINATTSQKTSSTIRLKNDFFRRG